MSLGLLLILALNLGLSSILAAAAEDCTEHSLCRDCLGDQQCVWCSDTDLAGPRCINHDSNPTCVQLEDPHGSVTSTDKGSGMEQIAPDLVELVLRVGEPQAFSVSVTPMADYPLDLYILMDLSTSMNDDLTSIKELSVGLAGTLGNITADFRIGFGSFIEKPLLPFIDLDFRLAQFVSDYSYRHVVSLTNDVDTFRNRIDMLETLSNLDAAEAMFDGIMQAVVCREVVGWREDARRLLLVLTDNGYHIAGDGRLAGLIRPHDGNCHVPLPDTNVTSISDPVDYQLWGVFDYPSVGHINAKLRENDIIPIFASTTEFRTTYEALVKEIEGAVFVTLQSNSDNFLAVIESSYNATSQRVELLPTSTVDLEINITPECGSAMLTGDGACEGVQVNQTVTFNVEVTLLHCSEDLRRGDTNIVDIRVPGFGKLRMEVSGICTCACENSAIYNSAECSNNGNSSCGVCECFEGRFGSKCQCNDETAVTFPCPVGGAAQLACSGRGRCECGGCVCGAPDPVIVPPGVTNAMYYGDVCECDNFTCNTNMAGEVCSGRGICGCDHQCTCNVSPTSGEVYLGDACQFLPMDEACRKQENNVYCSGNGECRQNEQSQQSQCICNQAFSGMFCNNTLKIISCDGERCVRCAKELTTNDCDNCDVVLIDPVDDVNYDINEIPAVECSFEDGDDCVHYYYTIGEEGPIHAENTKSCAEGLPIPIWAIVLIVVGVVLLIGVMACIIIKIILSMMDHVEYRRFKRNLNSADFAETENPLYHSPQQKLSNPIYRTPSKRAKEALKIDQ